MTKFHLADGLYFKQLPNGGVRITKEEKDSIEFAVDIDASGWGSVIASMSYYGEEDYGFYRAMNFHTGEPIGETTPINQEKLARS